MRGKAAFTLVCLFSWFVLASSSALAASPRFVPPVDAQISRPFKMLANKYSKGSHRGIDYAVAVGTQVRSSGDGTVSFAGEVAEDGKFVTIDHGEGIVTTYSFLSELKVEKGRVLKQGEVIALSGAGHPEDGDGPELHFGAKKHGSYINPELLFKDFSDISKLIQLKAQSGYYDAAVDPVPDASFDQAHLEPLQVGPPPFIGPQRLLPHLTGLRLNKDLLRPAPRPALGFRTPKVELGLRPLLGLPGSSLLPEEQQVIDNLNWWNSLSDEQKARLIREAPEQIGKMEGIDARSRDAANRRALNNEIARLIEQEAEAAKVLEKAKNGPRNGRYISLAHKTASEEWHAIKKRLDQAEHLKRQLTEVASRPRDAVEEEDVFLLDFDITFAGDEGKAVVAFGDPGRADNVGVVVPGITNRLDNVNGVLESASALYDEAYKAHGSAIGERTSVIAWLGYDTPESVFDAMGQGEAHAGANDLARFVGNLRVWNDGHSLANGNKQGKLKVSVFGHSYGSSTAALAAMSYGMEVNNLVLVGSPGAAGHNAGDLVGADQVWAARAWDDMIRFSTLFAALGDDPTNNNFGSKEFGLDSNQRGHGEYYERGSLGLENMAHILVGKPEWVRDDN
ncbi:MAG: alpha/beta hydrolase [Actinomycetota bacterium]